MQDKVDKLILNSRLAKLTVELDEALSRCEKGSDLWHTLNSMQEILREEYDEFKRTLNKGALV